MTDQTPTPTPTPAPAPAPAPTTALAELEAWFARHVQAPEARIEGALYHALHGLKEAIARLLSHLVIHG